MEQTDKELLLKDLCGRLPYGVMLNIEDFCDKYDEKLSCLALNHGNGLYINGLFAGNNGYDPNAIIKPYLRPLSSMTKDEKKELQSFYPGSFGEQWLNIEEGTIDIFECKSTITLYLDDSERLIDWLNAHHFDYRDLIPMGLAIDATGLNIY